MAAAAPAPAGKQIAIIGFGAVGQAFYRFLLHIQAKGQIPTSIARIAYWAPEIKEAKTEGIFSFNPAPFVSRENLKSLLDQIALAPGDILLELATRIDTHTMWKEVKSRGAHFLNSGFDVWPDITLDLNALDNLAADAVFSKGSGPTSVFSFGCNPGIASHFVRHGLKAATGIEDTKAAAAAFGLRSVSFNERDTQWAVKGSKGEAFLQSTQLDVLYNTWSPGNYIVETAESTILYAGCPEEVKEISSAGPAVVGWVPTGPNVGFLAPHDETFTIQGWFEKPIPAAFVYEAPPTARAYIKGGRAQHSSVATTKLLTPAAYDIKSDGYDLLGALLFSDKPGVAPFWCGIHQDVAGSIGVDPTGFVGPTPLQVVGGVWAALQFVLQHPDSGDCFPEDVPTPFVMENAFPWAGKLVARPAPEALEVATLFDPASPACLAQIQVGEPRAAAVTKGAAGGFTAAEALPVNAVVAQLSFDEASVLDSVLASGVKHAAQGAANAYVDRNRMIRTLAPVDAGAEITVNLSLLTAPGEEAKVAAHGATAYTAVAKDVLAAFVKAFPAILDEDLAAAAQ